jgi:hypothetical protein
MSGILANLPAITRVAQAGVQGYGLGGVVSATRMAASGLAGAGKLRSINPAPVLAIAAGVGGIAVAAYAIKSFRGQDHGSNQRTGGGQRPDGDAGGHDQTQRDAEGYAGEPKCLAPCISKSRNS